MSHQQTQFKKVHSPHELLKLPFKSSGNQLIYSFTLFSYAYCFFFPRQLTGIVATEHIRATGPLGDEAQGLTWLQLSPPLQRHRCLGPSPRVLLAYLEVGPVIPVILKLPS